MSEDELREIAEEMGNAVHEAWMEKRRIERGWHAPSECESLTEAPCPKCHPCMVPYAELPDSEKELDRQYPRLFLKILQDRGWKVVRA